MGDEEDVQFGKWLRVTPPGYKYGGGREGRSNGNWKGSNQLANYYASDGIDGKDTNCGHSSETGEEEMNGDSIESSAALMRKRGDTLTLQDSL